MQAMSAGTVEPGAADACEEPMQDPAHCLAMADTDSLQFIPTATVDVDIEYVFFGVLLLIISWRPRRLSTSITSDHERGPPTPVYLSTLRLRI